MDVPMNIVLMRERRIAKGWSQRELAQAAGIHPSVVNRIERNLQSDLTVTVLLALATALDLAPEDMLHPTRHQSIEQVSAELAAAFTDASALPHVHQKHLARLIRAYLTDLPQEGSE